DVALSVTLTTVSTLWGLFLTPMLVGFYTQDTVEVDQLGMLIMIAQTVVLPIIAGVAVNRWMPFVRQGIQPYLPTVASAAILLIIGIIVAINASELSVISYSLLAAVILHNLSGLALGYSIARWNGHTEVEARTIAIEVGMQNSGLGVALANSFFGPMAAVPGVLFSIWQNISGSVLASFWKWRTDKAIAQQLKNRKNVL
ncbi:MAG: bile acid:sodium symporter family protein, partial [Oleibacter sp.]|nr:bile acid:sodium symporter family protein [Thalassolituus sp.]